MSEPITAREVQELSGGAGWRPLRPWLMAAVFLILFAGAWFGDAGSGLPEGRPAVATAGADALGPSATAPPAQATGSVPDALQALGPARGDDPEPAMSAPVIWPAP